ncbi:MAG: hypothetical protein V7K67_19100 [Nostoc sp.]
MRSPNLIATTLKVKRSPESGKIGSGDRHRIIIVNQTNCDRTDSRYL